MKSETQSLNLRKMMEKQKLYPEYDLAFEKVCVKKKNIKNLEIGSVLLLGMNYLHMVLVKDSEIHAKVKLDNVGDYSIIEIVSLKETDVNKYDSKKYENVLCSLGKINCKKLELGHKVSISSLGIKEIEVFIDNNLYAKGKLVTVDDEIAVEIGELINE
ncbi:hypothetical protein MNB_SV-5-1183 [hydrothermal vent metagenome]|uniref:Flagellar motor switch protein FliN-like C-terminal domain-containing protein n=1 Tax=hydrothermal vent metagenome TaxID=652676 RepID=A0A1W1EDK3_9ZZZZ